MKKDQVRWEKVSVNVHAITVNRWDRTGTNPHKYMKL